jgi:hypothetical protein
MPTGSSRTTTKGGIVMPVRIAALLLALAVITHPATAARIADTEIPDSVRLAGVDSELLLNGGGVRKKFFMDIYVGALYLPTRTNDASAILSGSGPASVRMHFLYKEVSKEKITDGWNDGLSANLAPAEYAALQPRLEEFNRLFRTVRSGDVISIDFTPGTGTEVRINNELRGAVPGNDFYRALLKVWLGSEPVSDALKQGMLGND